MLERKSLVLKRHGSIIFCPNYGYELGPVRKRGAPIAVERLFRTDACELHAGFAQPEVIFPSESTKS